ncbi:coiled-coil domain-containing protein [Flavilitoribacter nigricans]|uniref:Rad50/SbcC-type AAA domain-containing protein n=1 Tax=Flavilitoribacter nigricans (strain ATCC 23147 / DSM 23189 / NBRC 102662 / NCIMB 1420 / SS-2) TaxID=1122177 RepID=A0A2D0N5V0_FLAN2|nr:hypothetical protein [Flavilitoribacter nigricans]PHN03875.1 hypothetical protein CRP01_23660 [Flavilitoribacter nigricans DSM 23189 = NBRC 102662]
MKIRLKRLTLQCRQSREILDLDHQVNFFHGKISAGKSSIVRLINYCLGGKLEKTTAIQKELVSASLFVEIGGNQVLLERTIESNDIQATWKNVNGEEFSVLAPIATAGGPIWEDDIFSLSDLLFYFFNIAPIKVKKSKVQDSSPLVRLSFRDFMWYSYLDQDHLDSSFFRLEDTFKSNKSKDVMRFVVGYYSEKLSQLEIRLEDFSKEKAGKTSAVAELKKFLVRFGYDSTEKVEKEISETAEKLSVAKIERKKLEEGYIKATHSGDTLRKQILPLVEIIAQKEEALFDLKERIIEQKSLRSELISSKFKLTRAESVDNVLSGVSFESCPQCGTNIQKRVIPTDHCSLCQSELKKNDNEETLSSNADIFRLELDDRIKELDNSIAFHNRATISLAKELVDFRNQKKKLDEDLRNKLQVYESQYLAGFREVDSNIAKYEERLKSQQNMLQIPKEINALEEQIDKLTLEIKKVRDNIRNEQSKLNQANLHISEIEEQFKEYMYEVGVPGVSKEDTVEINRKTWEVQIYPKGEEYLKWNFFNAGSGGKKTLFNVCYALAIHSVAARNELPLPTLLMIDTPMKNIGEDVNEDLFNNFYNLLYSLANSVLKNTQFVIIDKEFFKPQIEDIDLQSRFMTPDDDNHPPLIRYYRGA